MIDVAHVLAYAAIFTWLMIMAAAALGGKLWTPKGLMYGLGNRDTPSENAGLAGRADRAAKNMLENMILFTAVVAAAHFAGSAGKSQVQLGANVFLWARIAYWPTYLIGIPGLRTAIWTGSIIGIGMIAFAV